jgi:hypothetical protein
MRYATSESAVRRRAARAGLRLWKVREGSRWFHEYGPYALVDPSCAMVVERGLSLANVGESLAVVQE